MFNLTTEISQRTAAIVAGSALLIMTILSIFAEFFVFSSLVIPDDPTTTTNNIMADQWLFRLGICSFMIVAILDVFVAWALYVFLKPVNRDLSLLTAWFRLVYATVFGIALANLLSVLLLFNDAGYLTVFGAEQWQAQVMIRLNTFRYVWAGGFTFFGLHLFFLGYLVFASGYVPKILGILLVVASFGYLIDSVGLFLVPNYDANIGMFTFFGELLLMIWLLWRGIKGFNKNAEQKK
jgi:hypothetical protein